MVSTHHWILPACTLSALITAESAWGQSPPVKSPTSATAAAPKPAPKAAASTAATPAPGQEAQSSASPSNSPSAELLSDAPDILFALMHTEITIDFDETPAKEALAYIQDVLHVQMLIRWQSDKNPTGMDPAEPISLKLQRVAALTALEGVLEQLSTEESCTWQLRRGFLEVGTKSNLSRHGARETKLYPIKDLLYEVPYFDNAPNFNIDAAFNQGGGGGGGNGGGGGGGGMGGGGGFGGGGSGGGGSGGGGGGNLFGNAGASPERETDAAKSLRLIELIKTLVEPEAWINDWAFIDYTQGCLVVRAPDFVHRALGGYDFLPPPRMVNQSGTGRYVSMTVPMSFSQLRGFTPASVSGSAGGSGFGGGGAGGGGPTP